MTARRHQYWGIALGLAITLGTAGLLTPRLDPLERLALDLRFRYANRVPADPRIVHVDIDDGSLERIGRWPWPRDVVADLVRTLHELGASAIALDLLFDEPEPYRVNLATPSADAPGAERILGAMNEQNIVWPDLELADAVRRAGNVYLSMHFELQTGGSSIERRSELIRRLEAAPVVSGPATTLALAGKATTLIPSDVNLAEWRRARVVHALMREFSLNEDALTERLGLSRRDLAAVFAASKREAAARLAARLLDANPDTGIDDLMSLALPGQARDVVTADSRDLTRALRTQRALRVLRSRATALPAAWRGQVGSAEEIIAPLESLCAAARDVGFVVFRKDEDGKFREMPLLAEHEGRVLRQLGLALACDVLEVRDEDIAFTPDRYVELRSSAGSAVRRAPADAEARMIVPWTRTGAQWRRGADFPHLAAAGVLALSSDRRLMAENRTRINIRMADLIRATKREFAATYVERCEELVRLSRVQHQAALRGESGSAEATARARRIESLTQEIERDQRNSESMVELAYEQLRGLTPESDDERAEFEAVRTAHATLTGPIARLRAANRAIEQRITETHARLEPLIRDKIVFVGYTATALGDIVAAPIDANLPGVLAHSNVLNAFLVDRFVSRPHRSTVVVLMLLLGTVTTLLTATRGPIVTLGVTLATMAGYALLNFYVLFAGLGMWVLIVGPLASIALPWVLVTLYRQLTAERQKRYVQAQLAEFTDPKLARRIAEDPATAEALQRVENREVTCFFSDLQGFTTIAEQADSHRVQRVLNTYLDYMSEALFRHEAFLNKFLGDGIMAFFNPNVNPQPDHVQRATEAALDSFAALERLKRELGPSDELFLRLQMRIGIATGVAGVGRFGSKRKADYTVIGDVANLAARLEPANKVFGTRLLVSGPTRAVVEHQYVWRYLAELQVKGKRLTVPVYELVCRTGELNEEQAEYIRRFEAGVELYKQRRWDECIVAFTRILARRVDDAGASAYIDACQEKKLFAPDDEWTGALELKEK